MKNLEQIKEEYANQKGFRTWVDLTISLYDFENEIYAHTDTVAKIYADECAREALRLASENVTIIDKFGDDIGCYSFDNIGNKIWVNKQSILSETNIPKHK